jgi:hypothetical protein
MRAAHIRPAVIKRPPTSGTGSTPSAMVAILTSDAMANRMPATILVARSWKSTRPS